MSPIEVPEPSILFEVGMGFFPCRCHCQTPGRQNPPGASSSTPRTVESDQTCLIICANALFWVSDCDLEWQEWQDDFAFPNNPRSLCSPGTAAVWAVTMRLVVIAELLGWSVSQTKQMGEQEQRKKENRGSSSARMEYVPILPPACRSRDF